MSNHTVAEVHFEEIANIGDEGRNSDVFVIKDTALNTEMVMKRIPKKQFKDPDKYFDEARVLNAMKHPNVVEVNYACQDSDFVYITMPFYKNGSLSKYMATRFLTVREIIRFSVQFLSGLHNIHANGLMHFDLKPDNVLLSDRNEALLSDFGLAKYVDEYGFTTPDGLYVKHAPPEVLSTTKFSTVFDIYQAGLTMYRMCVGSECFNSQYDSYIVNGSFDNALFSKDLGEGRFPVRTAFPSHIPVKFQKVVLKCLEVNPGDRYQAVIEVINDISQIDKCFLDWQFSIDNQVKKWFKASSAGTRYFLEVDSAGKSTAYKISVAERKTKVPSYTKQKITNREILRFLKSVD